MEFHPYHNPIREHIYTIPSLVNAETEGVFETCAGVLSADFAKNIRSITLTGCGYSYAVCLAAKQILCRMTRLPVHVFPAIEVSRFTDTQNEDLQGVLLIGVSNSGEVSRVNEALMLYRRHGAATIGVTGNAAGTIKECCEALLLAEPPAMERALPLRGYAMTYLALLAIGRAISIGQGRLETVDMMSIRHELNDCMERLERFLPRMDESVFRFAQQTAKCTAFEFVGSGYERGAAFLGKIEMMGQAGIMASDEDAEQWLHCNFFMANPEKIGTMLFLASNSKAISRGLEALTYMVHLRRPVCVVTDAPELVRVASPFIVHLPPVSDLTVGLVELLPSSLLTGYLCEMIGETYSRGFRDQWAVFRDGRGTIKSKIIVE